MHDTLVILLSEIVGTPQVDTWAQVFKSQITDKPQKGQLFYLVSLQNQTDEETALLGKLLANKFEEDYFQSQNQPFEAIKESLIKLNEMAVSRSLDGVEIAAVCLVDKVMYAATLNGSSVILRRAEQTVDLLSAQNGINTASGFFKSDDLVILCSSGFIGLVGEDTIKKSLDHNTPEDIASGLAPIVLGSPVNSDSACLILRIGITKKTDTEIINQTEEQLPASEQKSAEVSMDNQLQPGFLKHGPDIFGILSKIPVRHLMEKARLVRLFPFWKNTGINTHKSKKTALSLIVIILILLTVSSIYGKVRQQEAARIAEFNSVYGNAKTKYEDGKAIIDLNNTQARNYLNTAKNLIDTQMALFNKKSASYKTAEKLLSDINNSLSDISGIYKIIPAPFYDLTLIKDKALGTKMSLYKNIAAILDQSNNSVYLLNLETKSPQTTTFGRDTGTVNLMANGTSVYLFSKEKGIFQTREGQKVNQVIKPDKEWGNITGFNTFGGNLYLLDIARGQISKYMVVENGFSEARSYLAGDVKPDFSKGMELVIDGFVWVLNSDGTVFKYGQGKPYNFFLSGLDQPFKEISGMYSGEDTKYLYIIDGGNNRVVLFNKDNGNYQAQYQWDQTISVSDLVVMEAQKKMYLLSGSKILSVDLK